MINVISISGLTPVSSGYCSKYCTNGEKCGGDLGFLSVYDSESTRPKSVSFTVEVTTGVRKHSFFIMALTLMMALSMSGVK